MFNQDQIKELLSNKYVAKCSEKSITYSNDFKLEAVAQYINEGLTAREIFRMAGFSLSTIGRKQPVECLKRWKKIFRSKGRKGLMAEARGGKGGRSKKPTDISDAAKIERLEAEVAYLKAENDFLAKLRAKRVE